MAKKRADQLLVENGFFASREKAKRHIMAGLVFYLQGNSWHRVSKPGALYPPDTRFQVKEVDRFVSRGGYKLLTAIEHFHLDIKNKICLDVGASTGGFTDCLLQHGANKVYALDVGFGQLDWKLRNDSRVINLENINIRQATPDTIPEPVDLITIDCSFISLKLVLPACLQFLKPRGEIIALVKPQFEVGKGQTSKGIVKSEEKRKQVLTNLKHFVSTELCLQWQGCVASKIKGTKGNQEYLVYLTR
ncbi:MAG: TlyA family RNA methyltransferase [Desulfonauticus sp.]|nr:TlyA family RNA methyltransferase [Desulfonauticus sp.]